MFKNKQKEFILFTRLFNCGSPCRMWWLLEAYMVSKQKWRNSGQTESIGVY